MECHAPRAFLGVVSLPLLDRLWVLKKKKVSENCVEI